MLWPLQDFAYHLLAVEISRQIIVQVVGKKRSENSVQLIPVDSVASSSRRSVELDDTPGAKKCQSLVPAECPVVNEGWV